jgi:hypothetical protein
MDLGRRAPGLIDQPITQIPENLMAKGILLALTNPVSPDRDAEFNHWYNEVHGAEVTALAGFRSMTRYRVKAQVVPPSDRPQYSYLAFYELDDIDQAEKSLAEGASKFAMSGSVDLKGALGLAFEKIFSTQD